MKLRRNYSEALPIIKILGTAFIAWKIACVITGTAYPLMVVSSGSMEPAFYRGDLIFLWNRQQRIHTGDIPVVWFDGCPLPMVHRAIQVSQQEVGGVSLSKQLILTKGDNNAVDDTTLYPEGQEFVYRENVVGLVRGYVPYVGWISLWLKESPLFLYIIMTVLVVLGVVS
ncbi:hypothetical protein AFCA_004908 [Aspergillus flavus]|uniref:Signal peptidase complex catalytic subunit SEC11 n=2 Tax=Aspergillus subgen. Circumdati TaxID=2720871 RepID=A0AB74C428_ASPFL|nr:signal peptidase I [Aspergillus oryzae 3.042]KDE80640.1 signal peptidase I [Aspergillus oryzae 100-8]RAQ61266.1 hypothetical protein COH20_003762 [Aspergillus flavus]RMZ41450.1 hypothetical protein CA14_001275 [Aspergillus flavus]UDD57405.1 hypothetical protein AFCA_004908 [Aspergillus flavus]|eukprot:EIT80580.1 signal peptidase I [Aspergillus oryzae 3.042]